MAAFGDRYYGGLEPRGWLEDHTRLRDHLPRDAERQVKQAYDRWHQTIRNGLEAETRLLFGIDGATTSPVPPPHVPMPPPRKRRNPVRVKIIEGLPLPFADVLGEFDVPDLWWLMAHRRLFSVTRTGLIELSQAAAIPRPLLRASGADDTFQNQADHVLEVIATLLRTPDIERLIQRLRAIDHDLLGAYFFRRPEVQIYWMVIGFFASLLDVSIEDLTIVVVTHELAHVYAHLGRDINGADWDTEAFAQADLRIVEGLAQLYTERVVRGLALEHPGAEDAFEALLEHQSPPYTIFKDWIALAGQDGETIRAAMIETRIARITEYQGFYAALERERLKRAAAARATEISESAVEEAVP
jgi:hypothetical protein